MVYIDDYAHHPSELNALIESVRHLFPGKKLTMVFQPHLFSRTRDFMDEFARALEAFDHLALLPIYPAREQPINGVTSEVLKSKINVSYRIGVKEPDQETMNKQIFVKIIEQLKKIEDRSDFLVEEIGMDMAAYEDQFFEVIENLFKLAFNKSQLGLIQMYLYQLSTDKDWDGTILLNDGKEEKVVEFKTATDVWEVINKIK